MPGGGQIGIVAYGNQNRIFNGNPDFTYFYKVFRRYTHFSQENISITLDGPNQMSLDTAVMLRAKIPRYADLMTDLYFVFDLPDIYSGIYDPVGANPATRLPSFRWIRMLGAMIIDNIGIYVGGSQIQQFPGEWIGVKATIDLPTDKYLKWRTLVGDVPELTNPEWGLYGKAVSYPFQKGDYPHNVLDPSGNNTAPSIPGRQIRVPLPFWFADNWGKALPLVALQLHEVEVRIQLRTLREIYRIMDNVFQTEPVRFGRSLQYNPALPIANDTTAPTPPYTNLTLQANYKTFTDPYGPLRNYYTDAGSTVPAQDSFIMNAHLEANYVYLTEAEQAAFANRELQQLVYQIQTFTFPSVTSQTRFDLDVHGLVNRFVFFGRRTDAIDSRNDYTNLSNWKYPCQAPYWPLGPTAPVPNAGQLLSYAQRDILRTVRLLLAGNELQEAKPAPFYEVQTAFATTRGTGGTGLNPGSLKPDDVMGPIYQMTFGLNASDHEQPSGALNTSRIREVQLEVQPWDLDPMSPFAYDFTVYCETMNTVKITNGLGGLGFAI